MFGLGWNTVRLHFNPFLLLVFLKVEFVDFQRINNVFVHCSRTYKYHFSLTFSLKMSSTVLFTHFKIILLQYFQFLVFNCIQIDPQLASVIFFFFTQFNNNSNKKNYPTHGFNPIQPNPCGLGWVKFFFNPPWWIGSKNPLNLTQSNPCTP